MNKNRKYSINAGIVTAGVFAAVVLVNLFVTLLVQKFPIKLDMTSEKIYELSAETKNMLKQYDTPVDIYFVAGAEYESSYRLLGNVAEVLEKYAQYCPNIQYTAVDSEKNPTFGQNYVKNGERIAVGTVILDAGERYQVYDYGKLYNTSMNQQGAQVVSSMRAEQVLNAGLRYLAGSGEDTAYLIKGHNETELTGLEAKLKDEHYTLKALHLATEDIPEDASLLILAAPKIDYSDDEIAKLDAFFDRAGRALVTFDYTCRELTRLYAYLGTWGIAVSDAVAVEQNQAHIVSQMGILLADYGSSTITEALAENERYIGYQPYAKGLQLLFSENGGYKTEPILLTTEQAYLTEDLESLKNGTGSTGAQIIAAASVKQGPAPAEEAVLVVSGSDALWSVDEQTVSGFGLANYDYADTVLAFLRGTEEDYSISPKYLAGGRIMINGAQGYAIGIAVIFTVPLAVLVYGIVVWFKRRHL